MINAMSKYYKLPTLPYGYKDLEPYMSEEQLKIHYEKHHAGYVKGANAILEKLERARKEGLEIDVKAILKALSFNIGGHILHSIFWPSMAPAGKGGGKPGGILADRIDEEFGSFERFKSEFTKAAATVEGSGWGALVLCRQTERLMIMQIEKHNINLYPGFPILMVLDVFEHAYYIDYKNERGRFIENWWNIVNWDEINRRLEKLL